jgi:hypothetical protein
MISPSANPDILNPITRSFMESNSRNSFVILNLLSTQKKCWEKCLEFDALALCDKREAIGGNSLFIL